MNKRNRFAGIVFLPMNLFQARRFQVSGSALLQPLLFVLFLTIGLSQSARAADAIITTQAIGSGKISPPGKVNAPQGQDISFSFLPTNVSFEVKSVKVDNQLVTPTPTTSYTFRPVKTKHTIQVAFAKKTFLLHPINQNLQMGSLQPNKMFKVPYGAKQTFTVTPKKGYKAVLRVDGQNMKEGIVNRPASFQLVNITAPHSIEARFEASNNTPVIATVSINASDPNNLPLHYQWKVSEGSIQNVDSATTQWTLPTGPGVHFANVLVSNQQGGYAARRIAVISDNLGTSPPVVTAPQNFEPITTFGKSFGYDSIFKVTEATDSTSLMLLNRLVYLPDFSLPDTLDGLAGDLQGRIVATLLDLPHDSDLTVLDSTTTHPHTHTNPADYIIGSVKLSDGSLCSTDDKFHDVSVTATATAVDNSLPPRPLPLGNPVTVRANAFGDYALPFPSGAAQVGIECESAPPVYVNFDSQTRLADIAILPSTAQPIITPDAGSMTATVANHSAGIFLPPELNQPSDHHPSGDKFLGFKGIDSQQQACLYYKSIGAVQDCDNQGNPSGAITFDDWKHKMQMDPYAQAGAKDVEATYVNRIDLNLTRRHHAISYADQPGAISVSVGDSHSCVLRADNTLACWGNNSSGQASPPVGSFKEVAAGIFHSCGIKTDGTVTCWGDNSSGQASPPAGSFNQISAGSDYSCGLKANGTLACWGTIDQAIIPAGNFSQVSVGSLYGCGLKTDNTLACWGTIDQATIPTGSFSQVSVGASHSCAIQSTNGSVICWGDNSSGQASPPTGSFNQISAGSNYSCGIKTDDHALACWGDNRDDQSVPPAGNFTQLSSTGYAHSCALKIDGTIVCWGRNSDGQTTAPDLKHRVAAYVCNHLGPKSSSKKDLELAITNALNDRNQVACVAMDYKTHNSAETPYVRFYIFAPNGQLSLSINLDGRQEKYVPGTCVACHGGDQYDGHFPGNRNGSPDVGAHFLPYDAGNFLFSSKSGLTKAAEQAAIHQLNNIVLQTNATLIERTLINAWYKSGNDTLDENYWPDDWKAEAANTNPVPNVNIEHLYKDVNARYCRTCHVALNRDGMGTGGRNFGNPEFYKRWTNQSYDAGPLTICGKSAFLRDNHTMPNSLVTFNLLWNDTHAVELLKQVFGQDCGPNTADPNLVIKP